MTLYCVKTSLGERRDGDYNVDNIYSYHIYLYMLIIYIYLELNFNSIKFPRLGRDGVI